MEPLLPRLVIMTMCAGLLSGTFGGAAPSYLCSILPTRVRPSNAGFGQANAWQAPRSVQVQVKFQF